MRWRETPEHDLAVRIFADLEREGLRLRVAEKVPGIGVETGYFHVCFRGLEGET